MTKQIMLQQRSSEIFEPSEGQQSLVRREQFFAVVAVSKTMMMANIGNALALVALEYYLNKLETHTVLWALVVYIFALMTINSAQRIRAAAGRNTASVRAPGKIVLSSIILAAIWCFPTIMILPGGNLLEVAFVSSLTAGMVAGGAIALYPIPLAAFAYVTILSFIAAISVVYSGILPVIPFGLVISGFSLVVVFSVRRHAGYFLSELHGRLRAEKQRDMINMLLNSLEDEGRYYLWQVDKYLNLTSAPEKLLRILNITWKKSRNVNIFDVLSKAGAVPYGNDKLAGNSLLASIRHHNVQKFDLKICLPDRRIFALVGKKMVGGRSDGLGFHGYLKDITAEVRASEKIYNLATQDTLTDLLNYREFANRATKKLEALRKESEFDVQQGLIHFLFLDIDNLKAINDNFGHSVGDHLIMDTAQKLIEVLPADSLVARKSGDEFVVLLFGCDHLRAAKISSTLMQKMNQVFYYDGLHISTSCCIGVSMSNVRNSSVKSLEVEADRALYFAKSQGKGQARFYKNSFGQSIRRKRMLSLDLKRAIEADDLKLLYQPIVDLGTGEILGAEALLRWDHPVLGAVSPEDTSAIAQVEGVGLELAEFVVRKSAEQAKNWKSGCFISVNLHPSDLLRSDLTGRIVSIVEAVDFAPEKLWLEVTESESLRNNKIVHCNLDKLREMGVKIAIDDFGAGYSSLSYLNVYPLDVIKVDKTLIRDCHQSSVNRIIVSALKSLGDLQNLTVVAEGVESQDEISALRKYGFEMAQGFAFYKAMEARKFQEELQNSLESHKRLISVAP